MTENRDDVRKYPLLSHMAGLWSEGACTQLDLKEKRISGGE